LDFGFYTFELNRIADLQYVGLANYARLFGDGLFHQALFTLL
jgi:multiple sugar transport system permease protein/lactose/L-arabinose transport system permease protein